MAKLKSYRVKLSIPFVGEIEGTWIPNEEEKKAAWELYVELITRISIVELKRGEGILREALTSLYSIFTTTREILRNYGPAVAKRTKKTEYSFGQLSVMILNCVLRPFLATWHPLLQEYEAKRSNELSIKEHEDAWDRNPELRKELAEVRKTLITYANHLAKVAGVKPLLSYSKIKKGTKKKPTKKRK